TTSAGDLVGAIPQRFEVPNVDDSGDARVTVTAPDGTVWSKKIQIKRRQEIEVAVGFTPSRGQVLVTRIGDTAPLVRCAQSRCGIELPTGTKVKLTAVLGDGATFSGYHQYPMRTAGELVGILGDPLAACSADDAVTAATKGSVFDCPVTITADTDVTAEFGLQPKEVDVALETPPIKELVKPLTPKPPPIRIDAEKLDDKPLQPALNPPPTH